MSAAGGGLCECGCGQRTNLARATISDRGWVRGQPLRYCLGHNNRLSPAEYLLDETTGCWVWQRAVLKTGYGSLRIAGRTVRAHRHYYEKHRGPIPQGLVLDHLCRNRRCVNPDHLEPVTFEENCRRGAQAKLTHEQVAEIRRRAARGEPQGPIAAEFGINASTVSQIHHRHRWA